jgi:hypothetical protein
MLRERWKLLLQAWWTCTSEQNPPRRSRVPAEQQHICQSYQKEVEAQKLALSGGHEEVDCTAAEGLRGGLRLQWMCRGGGAYPFQEARTT